MKCLNSVLRCNRLHWFGHVNQIELYSGQILNLKVEGNRSRGCPKKGWLDAIKDDLRQWNLQAETCKYHSEWRKQLKTASQTRWACNVMLMHTE